MLFKVPRHHFEQDSVMFRDMFSLPVGAEGTADGSSRETPLHLDGINKDEFRQLLRVLYPRSVIDTHHVMKYWYLPPTMV